MVYQRTMHVKNPGTPLPKTYCGKKPNLLSIANSLQTHETFSRCVNVSELDPTEIKSKLMPGFGWAVPPAGSAL